jgi:catechol 2,3-dioxygenase-like lactoylglutathione lyase family enzyme
MYSLGFSNGGPPAERRRALEPVTSSGPAFYAVDSIAVAARRNKRAEGAEKKRVRGIFYAGWSLLEKRGQVEIQKLDHIALYMNDRDAAADFLTSYLGLHVVDHTDRYTLVGAGGRIGKLTLFDAPEDTPSSRGIIERINLRVANPETAVARLPAEADLMSRDGGYLFTGPEGLPLALVPGGGDFTEYDLEGLVLRSGDPEGSAHGFVKMGFAPGENATTVKAGEYRLRLVTSAAGAETQGMLYHLGCLVDSAEKHRKEAEEQGLKIQDFVEGPNTVAVFVRGPEGVSVEYVEHKPTFSLT